MNSNEINQEAVEEVIKMFLRYKHICVVERNQLQILDDLVRFLHMKIEFTADRVSTKRRPKT